MKCGPTAGSILPWAIMLTLLGSCAPPAPVPSANPLPDTPALPTSSPTDSTARPAATATRTPLPTPVSSVFPIGRYFHQHGPASFCVFEFGEDGTYAYYWLATSVDPTGTEPYASGTYSIEGNLFIETSTSIPECPTPATYAWTYDGRELTFQAVGEDPCADRQGTYETPLRYRRAE